MDTRTLHKTSTKDQFLGIYPTNILAYLQKDISTRSLVVALFVITKNCEGVIWYSIETR